MTVLTAPVHICSKAARRLGEGCREKPSGEQWEPSVLAENQPGEAEARTGWLKWWKRLNPFSTATGGQHVVAQREETQCCEVVRSPWEGEEEVWARFAGKGQPEGG